jgi:hypothetical protein
LEEINMKGGTCIPEWVRGNIEESLARMYLAQIRRSLDSNGKPNIEGFEHLHKLKKLVEYGPPPEERALSGQLSIQLTSLLFGLLLPSPRPGG